MAMLEASLSKNDKKAYWLIGIFSVVVFLVIAVLSKVKLGFTPSFDVHIFAAIDALTNTIVAILLVAGLIAVRKGKWRLHRNIMIAAMLLSVVFLVSYIAHHLLAGEAKFGDLDHNGILSAAEKKQVGSLRTFYLLLLATHIILAAFILPFILFTAYRGLTGEFAAHQKLAKYTWPLWLYVATTGPIVYLMIKPYYQ
jgi:putative membrane protein